MRNLKVKLIGCLLALATIVNAAEESKTLKTRFVNFKSVVERSKLGKQEQSNFEALKKQMETVLEEKEKTLNDIVTKLENPEYLDSITAEAETDLKRKFRALSQELNAQQNQYFQTLNQANMKIVQKLTDVVNKAADKVAKRDSIDMIVNEESTFFFNPLLDISDQIVAAMDEDFDKEFKAVK
jgi:outer membrane protein